MRKDETRQAAQQRSEELRLAVSPAALQLLARLAASRGMSCEALAREYLSRGLMEDRLRAFAETASTTVEAVLRERLPDEAESVMDEVRRRFAETG